MNILNKLFFGLVIAVIIGCASTPRQMLNAPLGTVIKATPIAHDTIEISWTEHLPVSHFLRMYQHGSSQTGLITDPKLTTDNRSFMHNVCTSEAEHPFDTRFQLRNKGNWLLINEYGVPGATLDGVEVGPCQNGCTLKVTDEIANKACSMMP